MAAIIKQQNWRKQQITLPPQQSGRIREHKQQIHHQKKHQNWRKQLYHYYRCSIYFEDDPDQITLPPLDFLHGHHHPRLPPPPRPPRPPQPPSLGLNLRRATDKRRSTRETALSSIVQTLATEPHHREFIDENFATLTYDCLSRLTQKKKNSSNFSKKEVRLAVRCVALVAINLVDKDSTHEIFDDCVPALSDALLHCKSSCDNELAWEVINCLAIVGFYGSGYSGQTQRVMLIIWDFVTNHDNPNVIALGISAWCFLLTILHGSSLSTKHWRGTISYLWDLLNKKRESDQANQGDDDECVFLVATQALALIFRIGFLKKFSEKGMGKFSLLKKEIKEKIEEKLKLGEISEENMGILKLFDSENGDYYEELEMVGELSKLNLSKVIQRNFIKEFLGEDGFINHIGVNENLDMLFEFPWKRKVWKDDESDIYTPEREEVSVRFYKPGRKQMGIRPILPYLSGREKKIEKRMTMSPSSLLNKARTQLLHKQREILNRISMEYSEVLDD